MSLILGNCSKDSLPSSPQPFFSWVNFVHIKHNLPLQPSYKIIYTKFSNLSPKTTFRTSSKFSLSQRKRLTNTWQYLCIYILSHPSKSFKAKQSVFPPSSVWKDCISGEDTQSWSLPGPLLSKRPVFESVCNCKVSGCPVTVTREARVHLQRELNPAHDKRSQRSNVFMKA